MIWQSEELSMNQNEGIGLISVKSAGKALERGISFYDALRSADLIGNIGRSLPKIDSFVALIEHFKEQAEKISLRN